MARVLAMLLATLLTGAVLAGCQPAHFDDPVSQMLRRDRGTDWRLTAARQIGPIESADDPQRYHDALHRLAWRDDQPIELRRFAIDRMIEHDPRAFQRRVERQIGNVGAWPALQYLFEQAAEHKWRDFAPTAVRSYARPSIRYKDSERPERELLATLYPQRDVDELIYEIFIGLDWDVELKHRVAAWTVLARVHDDDELRGLLDAAPPLPGLVTDLQAAADLLDVLPDRDKQYLGLLHLRNKDGGRWWQRVSERVAKLSEAQRRGLAMRHLPLLALQDADAQRVSRAALTKRIRERIERWSSDRAAEKEASSDDQLASLPWGDLLAIDAIQRVLARPETRRAMFEQAEKDRHDTHSEHGGAIVANDGRWQPRAFAAGFRLHDRQYVASTELILIHMPTSLAHYHFHAQKHDNAQFAHPGGGDLGFVERFGVHGFVLTYLDADTLNVDYYQPDGVVVDLGNLHARDRAAR